MLTKVGTSATNGQGGFASVASSAPYDLTDCDTFGVMLYGGPWVGTIQFEGSLDGSNWFPITMHNINGTIAPSTTTNVNGVFFQPSSPALLYCRINMTAYTSGALSFLIVGHRVGHVDYTDFWSTAMPFTRDAVFAIDASRAVVGETVVVNAGTGGTALNATLGSTGGVDSNDPLLLPWTGEDYLYLPGVAGNYASAPDSAALDITGDIEIVVRVALDDWSPAATQSFVGKWTTGTNQRSYDLQINGTSLTLLAASDGLNNGASEQCAVTFNTAVDGQTYWIKGTRVAGTGLCSFFYAADRGIEPTSWTSIGTNTMTYTGSIFSGSGIIEVGAVGQGASFPLAGRIYRGIVRNGIGGTTVFDADFATGITSGAQTTFTELSSNAATVTINRSTAGRKSVAVTRPVWLFGTDDYMEVADNALLNMDASQSFTVLAVVRQWDTIQINGQIVTKGAYTTLTNTPGWLLYNNGTTTSTKFLVSDTLTFPNASSSVTPTVGTVNVMTGVRDRANLLLRTYNNGTASTTVADTTTITLTNTSPLRIGSQLGTFFATTTDFELLAVAIFRRALSGTEIASINTYFGG
jgi:hypothetical protein